MIRLENSKFEDHLYLDHHYPPTLWNIVRGGFDSVDNLPLDDHDFALSVAMASMIGNGAAMRLESDLRIEMVGQLVSPPQNSG